MKLVCGDSGFAPSTVGQCQAGPPGGCPTSPVFVRPGVLLAGGPPGWQGFRDEGPRHLQSCRVSFQLFQKNRDFVQITDSCCHDISEMILYEGFIADGIGVSWVLTQCLTQNDEASGVFHLGLDGLEVGMLSDLVPIRRPQLCFLGLEAESCIMNCPGQGLKNFRNIIGRTDYPEGPKIEKIQSRDARLKNSRFQSRNEIFDREWFFQSDASLAAEKQGLGLKFLIENEIFEPRMKISSENDFSCVWEWFFQAIERE